MFAGLDTGPTLEALMGAMGTAFIFPTYARVMTKVALATKIAFLVMEMVL